MARITVIFERSGPWPFLQLPADPQTCERGVRAACLDIPDNLETLDIYEQVRRLASLLLENLPQADATSP